MWRWTWQVTVCRHIVLLELSTLHPSTWRMSAELSTVCEFKAFCRNSPLRCSCLCPWLHHSRTLENWQILATFSLFCDEMLNLPVWWSVKWTPTALQLKKLSIIGHSMGESASHQNLSSAFCFVKLFIFFFIYRWWHCCNGKCSFYTTNNILLFFQVQSSYWSKLMFPTVRLSVSWDGGGACTSGRFWVPAYRHRKNHSETQNYWRASVVCVLVLTLKEEFNFSLLYLL